jgi:predicted TIM-barrel fold metal-dependent hydrolase
MKSLELNDVDRRIWRDELDEYVPRRVFDVHTHLYRFAFNLDPNKDTGPYKKFVGDDWVDVPYELAQAVDAALMPGRDVSRLSFPFPFPYPCDFAASNEWVARESAKDPRSASLMLAHPRMSDDEAEAELDRHGHIGFKPYRFYSATGDAANCRMTDFLPERFLSIADRRGLIVMMHISKRDAIADAENLRDLEDLSARYPNVRWILAHCARSYSHWAIERAGPVLRKLPNLWYDVSSVCETDAIDALLSNVDPNRVMYGSDDVPVGVLRGKYISFGYAWAYLSETNQSLSLVHCDGRMTFTRYEQLRAMQCASRRLGQTPQQIQALFYDIAADLVAGARQGR